MNDYDDRPELEPGEALAPELEAELAEALRAAYRPEALAPERQRELLALALEDPFAPATAEEIRESERLRRALDEGDESHAGARLAHALRAAVEPGAESAPVERHARTAASPTLPNAGKRGNVVYASFGALAVAAAAGFALFVAGTGSEEPETAAVARPALVQSRTTGPLFAAPFEPGQTTARIDRIAELRGRELRENRYAKWGVR
jgi:hypothetical protein